MRIWILFQKTAYPFLFQKNTLPVGMSVFIPKNPVGVQARFFSKNPCTPCRVNNRCPLAAAGQRMNAATPTLS